MTDIETILWRRLDFPGHDACRLTKGDRGWRLQGVALFSCAGAPACLWYRIDCDRHWRSRSGAVQGWIGERSLQLRIKRTREHQWTLNGRLVPHVVGCVDLDLGFTPATNLAQIRRIALPVGQGQRVPVAWLDVRAGTLSALEQYYERRGVHDYWYEAPRFEYAGLLQVNAAGFVWKYPKLWEAEL